MGDIAKDAGYLVALQPTTQGARTREQPRAAATAARWPSDGDFDLAYYGEAGGPSLNVIRSAEGERTLPPMPMEAVLMR